VLTVNVADDAPAATVTEAGTVADALLLARVTTVADGAVALSLTVPWTELPPVTDVALNVTDESESGVGVGVPGVTVTVTSRRPSWSFRTRTVAL
jgi:arginine/ornithine N-succinyltransferase beta subunit